jgi:hypothetical protein
MNDREVLNELKLYLETSKDKYFEIWNSQYEVGYDTSAYLCEEILSEIERLEKL